MTQNRLCWKAEWSDVYIALHCVCVLSWRSACQSANIARALAHTQRNNGRVKNDGVRSILEIIFFFFRFFVTEKLYSSCGDFVFKRWGFFFLSYRTLLFCTFWEQKIFCEYYNVQCLCHFIQFAYWGRLVFSPYYIIIAASMLI